MADEHTSGAFSVNRCTRLTSLAFSSACCSFLSFSSKFLARTSVLALEKPFLVFFFLSFLAKKSSKSAIMKAVNKPKCPKKGCEISLMKWFVHVEVLSMCNNSTSESSPTLLFVAVKIVFLQVISYNFPDL